jgi:hypothetical protein
MGTTTQVRKTVAVRFEIVEITLRAAPNPLGTSP